MIRCCIGLRSWTREHETFGVAAKKWGGGGGSLVEPPLPRGLPLRRGEVGGCGAGCDQRLGRLWYAYLPGEGLSLLLPCLAVYRCSAQSSPLLLACLAGISRCTISDGDGAELDMCPHIHHTSLGVSPSFPWVSRGGGPSKKSSKGVFRGSRWVSRRGGWRTLQKRVPNGYPDAPHGCPGSGGGGSPEKGPNGVPRGPPWVPRWGGPP